MQLSFTKCRKENTVECGYKDIEYDGGGGEEIYLEQLGVCGTTHFEEI